jgi:NAD(P)H dehydrogenase (quinone)
MCFPSKTQKALYSDESTKQTSPDTKAPAPVTSPSTTPNDSSPMAPTVAIVIYTLYGHIAKRSCLTLHFPSSIPLICSYLLLVAEAEKRGIEAAGGSATIYQ